MGRLTIDTNFIFDDEYTKTMYEMLCEISNTDVSKQFSFSRNQNQFAYSFFIDFDDIEDETHVRMIVKSLNVHRYTPYEKFSIIRPSDFEFHIDTQNISLIQYVSHLNEQFLSDQIKALDWIVSVQIEEQNKLTERVDTLYSFILKAGLIDHTASYTSLLNALDSQGLIKKEDFETTKPSIH